ncbi:beta-ketoacyl-ACP synthase II [Polycladomyces sp. WAk]|uniref:3-oxoacyl-[acyl-carrier-protein] synthase 2 n=1 Tax=Polycladomyces zharkentensis TaxID=2807616 RepID=A0ABS2WGK8_9BACL|nr:beta-ketoacyl-ACP synthase II [Polycladomyces sp. WAk]MBN2908651.1 beta-ketoacyl-ACP synthase II [Polycladomyces sp. WAk]
MKKRVVITGMGALTPIGHNVPGFWEGLQEGRSGVRSISRFDPTGFPTTIAAEIPDYDPLDHFEAKVARRMSRFAQYGMVAAREAVRHAQLEMDRVDPVRVGVMVGTGSGGLDRIQEEYQKVLQNGSQKLSPYLAPAMLANMASGEIAIALGAKGPSAAVVTACATGSSCIGEAMRIIQYGEADVMIAGGAEAPITPLGLAAFSRIRALSRRNEEPQKACRPFDRDRDGFVAGEGAGVVVLESLEHAVKRGVPILAELIGYGATTDAHHITAPSPDGAVAAEAMVRALRDAGLSSEQVDYINAHGTGTRVNDAVETMAVKRVFGEAAYRIPISSIKSMIGHLLGAAGAVELISSIQTIQHGVIPPTINCEGQEKGLDLDYVPHRARKRDVQVVMSNSFGFGGHNVSLIVRRWDPSINP